LSSLFVILARDAVLAWYMP